MCSCLFQVTPLTAWFRTHHFHYQFIKKARYQSEETTWKVPSWPRRRRFLRHLLETQWRRYTFFHLIDTPTVCTRMTFSVLSELNKHSDSALDVSVSRIYSESANQLRIACIPHPLTVSSEGLVLITLSISALSMSSLPLKHCETGSVWLICRSTGRSLDYGE